MLCSWDPQPNLCLYSISLPPPPTFQKMEDGAGILKTAWLSAESFQPEIHWSSLFGTVRALDTSGNGCLAVVSTLQALASPHRPAKVDDIAMCHNSWVKIWRRNWGWMKYFLSSEILPIKLKRREQIKKASMVIRADIRNPSHSECDSHAEHKFTNTITGCTQPRSKSFALHGSFYWGCSHFLGVFTLVVEAEMWHVRWS